MSKKTLTKHQERVVKLMKEMGSLTALVAMKELGVMRLSAVIFELKALGFNIEKVYESSKNRYGEPVRYAIYSFVVEKTN